MMSNNAGEYDLSTLIRTMSPQLGSDVFVFLTLHDNDVVPKTVLDAAVVTVKEKEGRTFVLARSIVETLGYQFEYPCKMITLQVHSGLAAVGFLAVILRHLADNGISCNVASGFYHDHLFVQDGDEEKVMTLLKMLSDSVNDSSDEEDVNSENDLSDDINEPSNLVNEENPVTRKMEYADENERENIKSNEFDTPKIQEDSKNIKEDKENEDNQNVVIVYSESDENDEDIEH